MSWLSPRDKLLLFLCCTEMQAQTNMKPEHHAEIGDWLFPRPHMLTAPCSQHWPWPLPSILPDDQTWTNRALHQCQQDLFYETKVVPMSSLNIAQHNKSLGRHKARYKLLLKKWKNVRVYNDDPNIFQLICPGPYQGTCPDMAGSSEGLSVNKSGSKFVTVFK